MVWRWLENARIRTKSLEKSRFSQFLLGWSPRWSRSITWGFEFSAAQSVDHDDRLTFMKHLVQRKSQFPCGMLFLRLAQKQVQIWGRRFSSILGFRSPNFAQRNTLEYWSRINRHFEVLGEERSGNGISTIGKWKFTILQIQCRTEWFCIHVKTAFIHLSVWLIGGSYAVVPGLIPGSLKLRQKSNVGQEIANLQIWDFFKLEILIQF